MLTLTLRSSVVGGIGVVTVRAYIRRRICLSFSFAFPTSYGNFVAFPPDTNASSLIVILLALLRGGMFLLKNIGLVLYSKTS